MHCMVFSWYCIRRMGPSRASSVGWMKRCNSVAARCHVGCVGLSWEAYVHPTTGKKFAGPEADAGPQEIDDGAYQAL